MARFDLAGRADEAGPDEPGRALQVGVVDARVERLRERGRFVQPQSGRQRCSRRIISSHGGGSSSLLASPSSSERWMASSITFPLSAAGSVFKTSRLNRGMPLAGRHPYEADGGAGQLQLA